MTHQYITEREKEENGILFKKAQQAAANLKAYRVIYPLAEQTEQQQAVDQALYQEWKAATDAWQKATSCYFFA